MVSSSEYEKSQEQYNELQELFNSISLQSEVETTESLKRDLVELQLKLTQKTAEVDTLQSDVSTLTEERNYFEREYESSVHRESEFKNRFLSLQTEVNNQLLFIRTEYNNLKENNGKDCIKYVCQINDITKERDDAYKHVEVIQSQLVHSEESVEDLENKQFQLGCDLEAASKAYKELATQNENYIAEKKSLEASLNDTNYQLKNLKSDNNNLSSRIEQCEKVFQACQSENRNLKEHIASIDLELSETKNELIDFKRKVNTLHDEKSSLLTRLQSTTDAYNATIAAYNATTADYNATTATAEEQIKVLTATAEAYKSSYETTYNELAHADDCIRTLKNDIEICRNVISNNEQALSAQAEIIQEKADLQKRVTVLNTENTSKENDLQIARQVVEENDNVITELQDKSEDQTKTTEEYHQTITALRADVSTLTFEIKEYKSKTKTATANAESVNANYKREAAEWAESEDNLKKNLAESEKQREELVDKVEVLVKKYDGCQSSVETEDSKKRYDALMSQNHKLAQENKRLKEREENVKQELKKKIEEFDPLLNKISSLEVQLKSIQEENEMLNKSQQECASTSVLSTNASTSPAPPTPLPPPRTPLVAELATHAEVDEDTTATEVTAEEVSDTHKKATGKKRGRDNEEEEKEIGSPLAKKI